MVSLKSFAKVLTGISLIAIGIVYSLNKKEELAEFISKPSSAIEILNKEYPVSMMYGSGEKIIEHPLINARFDKETNTLYLGNYSQNYNKQNWPENETLPVYQRHTQINEAYSRVIIAHSSNVKISGLEQKAYLIPDYKWDEKLKPLEEHEGGKEIIEGSKRIVDWAVSLIPSEKFKQDIERLTLSSRETSISKDYEELLQKINQKEYIAELIPQYVPQKIIGNSITAKEYVIHFNGENSAVYILERVAFGDPSRNSQNRYGELEKIVIKFDIGKNSNPPVEVEKSKDEDKTEVLAYLKNKAEEYLEKTISKNSAKEIVDQYLDCLKPYFSSSDDFVCSEYFLNSEEYDRYLNLKEIFGDRIILYSTEELRKEIVERSSRMLRLYSEKKEFLKINEFEKIDSSLRKNLVEKDVNVKLVIASPIDKEEFPRIKNGASFLMLKIKDDWKISMIRGD